MTTAASTEFIVAEIVVHGRTFYFDGNQKITAGNGDFERPKPNAFSTVQAQDCPFRTPTCDSTCYVHNLQKYQPEIHKHYQINSEHIREAMTNGFYETAYAFADWISDNAQGGFRWHVSGDIFSMRYSEFINEVCREASDVNHWIYTRSFPFLEPILNVPNLTINLSADKDNYWLARRYADQHDLRVCYLTIEGEVPEDLKPGDVIFPDYGLRGVGQKPFEFRRDSEWWNSLEGRNKKLVCPTDVYGKSENVRCGPCKKCLI